MPTYIEPVPPWNLDTGRNGVIAGYNTRMVTIAGADPNDTGFVRPRCGAHPFVSASNSQRTLIACRTLRTNHHDASVPF